MSDEAWVIVYTAEGKLSAEIIRLNLESFGIPAVLEQESLGNIYGFTVGPLAEAHILVPVSKAEEAKDILQKMETGKLESEVEPGQKESNKDEDSRLTK